VRPSDALDHEVEQLARRENRTLANMVETLCKRQLEIMRAADTKQRLAEVIRGDAGSA
jgi:DNA helicase IV